VTNRKPPRKKPRELRGAALGRMLGSLSPTQLRALVSGLSIAERRKLLAALPVEKPHKPKKDSTRKASTPKPAAVVSTTTRKTVAVTTTTKKPTTKTPAKKTATRKAITSAARSQLTYKRYFDRVGAKRVATRFHVSAATARRWRETGVPIKQIDEVAEKAVRTLQASQEFFAKFVRRVGRARAAQVLGLSTSLIGKYMAVGAPPRLVPRLKKKIRAHRIRQQGGTTTQRSQALKAARELAKKPPTLPTPAATPAPVIPKRPGILPKFRPPKRKAPKPRKGVPVGFDKEAWNRALRGFLEARHEAYADSRVSRTSPRLRKIVERVRGSDVVFFDKGIRVEQFVSQLDMDALADLIYERTLKVVSPRRGGVLQLRFTCGGNVQQGNPFYAPVASLVMGASSMYQSFSASSAITDTKMRDWKSRLRARINEILVGPVNDSTATNSLIELLPYMPLLFLENVEITYQPPGGWTRLHHLR
jgi:hypothetical protein